MKMKGYIELQKDNINDTCKVPKIETYLACF